MQQGGVSLSVSYIRAFERLLEVGAPQSDIDNFLNELKSRPDESLKILPRYFSKSGGVVQDQIQFLSNLYANGMHIDRRPGSRTAFIFFSCSLDPAGTAMARSRLCRMNANSIYLYDDQLMNFAFGVRQCGTDVRQTDAAVMQSVREWRVNRIITVGESGAGFAAINRALSLNAYASVTFSPFTTFADEHYQQDGRGKATIDRFKKLAPDLLIDLVPLLAKREPPLKLVCFYPEGMPKDVWQAKRVEGIRDASTIGVNLEFHAILGALIETGMFDAFMQPLAGGGSVENCIDLAVSRFPRRP
jgi:hypothetical protein